MPDEIHDILLKKLTGTLTEEEAFAFEKWHQYSDDNRKVYADYLRIWNIEDALPIPDFDTPGEWASLSEKITSEKHVIRGFGRYSWYKIAASVLLLCVASYLLYQHFKRGLQFFETQDTTVLHVLADGTKVWLDKQSKLEYTGFSRKDRQVLLSGQAFFEVVRDSTQRFIVRTKSGVVQVLGTSFNVRARDDEDNVSVEVASGKVRFESPVGKSIDVRRGEKITFHSATHDLMHEMVEGSNVTAWRDRRLVFKKQRLESVIKQVTEYFDVQIQVQDSTSLHCLVTSTFENPTLDEVLEPIGEALGLTVVKTDDNYRLEGKGCAP